MKKCMLILPPELRGETVGASRATEDAAGYFPPLGLLHIASYAELLESVEIVVLDSIAKRLTLRQVEEEMKAMAPDVIGIQAMTFTLYAASEVAKVARRVVPDAKIIIGGPHVAIYPGETIRLPYVDYVIYGEGEFAFRDLLQALNDGKSPEGIPGVITKETDLAQISLQTMEDLDSLLPAARHLLDQSLYRSALSKTDRLTTIMSSRGCPGQCTFCDRPQWGNRFRKRAAKLVFKEMKDCCNNLGIKEFVFFDDTFTIDKQRVLDLCTLLIAEKLPVTWDVRARIDSVNLEMIDALAKAGCVRVRYGVETGSPRLQKYTRKNLNLDRIHEIVTATSKSGMEVLGYFMIGFPTETREEIEQTIELMCALPFDYVTASIFTPFPGTYAYNQALEQGIYDKDYWREFAENPTSNFIPPVFEDGFSRKELLDIQREAIRRFYFRPSYIFRRLSKLHSAHELWNQGLTGLRLFQESFFGKRMGKN